MNDEEIVRILKRYSLNPVKRNHVKLKAFQRDIGGIKAEDEEKESTRNEVQKTYKEFTCKTCERIFDNHQEMTAHYKCRWHQENLRRKILKKKRIDEKEWEERGENTEDSQFHDDDDYEEDEEEEDHGEMEKDQDDDRERNDDDLGESKEEQKETHNVRIKASTLELRVGKYLIEVSRGLVKNEKDLEVPEILKELANLKTETVAFLLLRSGKFAGAIFDHDQAILHKTFSRYTVRKKAGGGQASYDSSGRRPKSAGATLRRYGEAQLQEDVHGVLTAWAPYLTHLVYDEEKKFFLKKSDSRLRKIPYMLPKTRFKDIAELYEKIHTLTILESNDMIENPSEEQRKSKSMVSTIKKSENESTRHDNTNEIKEKEPPKIPDPEFRQEYHDLIEACVNGNHDVLETRLKEGQNELDKELRLYNKGTSLLHIAASQDDSNLITFLLKSGFNPTVRDLHNRTPYQSCLSKECRDTFRRFRSEHEEKWDWEEANVPEALTKEMEEKRKKANADKKRRQREKKKEQRSKEAAAKIEDVSITSKSGEDEKTKSSLSAEKGKGSSRKNLELGSCGNCGKELSDSSKFEIHEYNLYCSTNCVRLHRRRVMAEAAERRLRGAK